MLEVKLTEISPQMYKKVYTFTEDPIKGTKARKTETIYTATVMLNDYVFDADESSMDRMNRYLQIANSDFNKDQANEMSVTDAYQKNYIDTTVQWKLADNTVQEITIEQLVEVYKLAVSNMANNWL
jgi:tryptophan 2,3-dioxygenase